MTRGYFLAVIGGVAAAGLTIAVAAAAAPPGDPGHGFYTEDQLAAIYRHAPLGKLPPGPTDGVADNTAAATLGQFLFFDADLSGNGKVSCATCHQPAHAFTDGRSIAKGIALGTRHTPTVLNAAFNHWFFWDGRADSLWAQALQPLENPREAGGDRLHIVHLVAADTALARAYQQVFGPLPPLADRARFPAHARPDADPHAPLAVAWQAMAPADRTAVDRVYSNLGKAIEAYERKLVGGPAPFDTYVEGLRSGDAAKQRAISDAAKRGLRLFVGTANCDLCHSGPTFSDGQFHNLGLPLLPGETPDTGRADGIRLLRADIFNAAGPFSDDPAGPAKQRLEFLPAPASQLGAFKTPSLRNVAVTAPYMHDGRFATLRQVLDFYAQGAAASHGRLVGTREATANLVPHLTASQETDLIAFLQSLTGAPLPPALTEPPPRP
ncbi:MAG TPA: cytochrome c peroxidase [Stellaceae bacterium]|nr:cytochrome c peroxidase [Stellaceae bacterium]